MSGRMFDFYGLHSTAPAIEHGEHGQQIKTRMVAGYRAAQTSDSDKAFAASLSDAELWDMIRTAPVTVDYLVHNVATLIGVLAQFEKRLDRLEASAQPPT